MYGINRESLIDEDDERDLNDDETDLLAEFAKNDQEIDDIVDMINNELDGLKEGVKGVAE